MIQPNQELTGIRRLSGSDAAGMAIRIEGCAFMPAKITAFRGEFRDAGRRLFRCRAAGIARLLTRQRQPRGASGRVRAYQ